MKTTISHAQESNIRDVELTTEDLEAVSGGRTNSETPLWNAFWGGVVKGYMDAGGSVDIRFH